MDRRMFLGKAISGGTIAYAVPPYLHASQSNAIIPAKDLVIEHDLPGQPHKGKVLAAIQPHSDDIPIFAAGTVAKLIREGYSGILIRTTNDDHAGPGTVGDTVVANEVDNDSVARILGLSKVFNLGSRNHRMEDIDIIELKARLIFLFRVLKVDTVISYDPWGLYEENPDHYITARAVEAACWQAGGGKDYPEHFSAGIQPHSVSEKYYHARGPQLVNRVVDIGSVIDLKIKANVANKAQGPAGDNGARLRGRLAGEHRRLPLLGSDGETANYQYVKEFLLADERELGRKYELKYAEAFHYIGPGTDYASHLDEYIRQNAVPLENGSSKPGR
jgi:LmbE family N-acetylglucosaminyl deacetylase